MPDLHILIITHTHERIARTIMGLGAQTLEPRSITVACDSDDARVYSEVQRVSSEIGIPVTLVLRKRGEHSCRSQNRNNAVRALIEKGVDKDDRLLFFDGDCIPCPDACAVHMDALCTHSISLGWAIRLSAFQTESVSDEIIHSGQIGGLLDEDQKRAADRAHFQSQKRIMLKRFGFTKPHKPGILSGNFGVRLSSFLAVNGFDESFTGWGMEDDDLGRRLYMSGAKPKSVMNRAIVYHQDHPTESPSKWKESPNAARLDKKTGVRCALGIDCPATQHPPVIHKLEPSYPKVQLDGIV